ncbi:MAG: hypothetical protein HGN29_07845 [Asgard group archaeon]|nr:hypothetical protein [Asgard group archaeon]
MSVEIFSAALGMLSAYYYGQFIFTGIAVLLPQIGITIIAFILDFKRWLWLLGIKKEAPNYVTIVHKEKRISNDLHLCKFFCKIRS